MTLKATHAAIRNWYELYGRKDLPWRHTSDPYEIYISEVMLQQTQVATVLERFYFPFLKRFPTLSALAESSLEEVLTYWQGLGYYRRAAHLHQAAQHTAPHLPEDVKALEALPGIGKNTAHAIAAFAWHKPVLVMEANVKRILQRVFVLREASDALLWEYAFQLLDKEHPFIYNQAMMDIGAMVCTKKKPHCLICPLKEICEGKEAPEEYPAFKAKKKVPVIRKRIVAFKNSKGEYYITARTTRFLHGLYGFMEYEGEEMLLAFQGKQLALEEAVYKGDVRQSYSHFTLEAEVYEMEAEGEGGNWREIEKIKELPLSEADKKVLKRIKEG